MRYLIFFLLLIQVVNSELPKSHFFLEKEGFCLEYDGRTRQPVWVCEVLERNCFSGEVSRKHFRFCEEKELPQIVRSVLADYHKSGFDRGHMAAAANHSDSMQSMKDSFYLSNISPQDPGFNRGAWAKLEGRVREIVHKFRRAVILTGPLYLPQKSKNGRSYVTYEVIGDRGVAVPTHYFKIIKTSDFEEGYILPNRNISPKESLKNFQVTVEKIEKVAGIVF